MKKLKPILCVALLLVVGAVMFAGCGPKVKQQTISLEEAKTTIINALKLDEPQVEAMAEPSASEEGNRDVLEKFGKFKITAQGESYVYPSNQLSNTSTSNGTFEYKEGKFLKYIINSNDSSLGSQAEYLESNTIYINEADIIRTQEYVDNSGMGYAESMGQAFVAQSNALFTDEAFEKVYEDTVIKQTTSDGYSFILKLDFKGYYRLLTIKSMSDEEFEQSWALQEQAFNALPKDLMKDNAFSITVSFDNDDEIVKVVTDCTVGQVLLLDSEMVMAKNHSTTTITKYTGEISEPQWVTDYKSQNN